MSRKLLILFMMMAFIYWRSGPAFAANVVVPSAHESIIETYEGKYISIKLDSNVSTGFQWQLAGPVDNNILEFVSSKYMPSYKKLAGVGGREIWRFKAVKKGQAKVLFNYLRLWEKDVSVIKKAFFTVIVREKNNK